MELILFLCKATALSLTGVLAPGAVTAATIAQGTKNRWAGTMISVGHGIIEFPLIFFLMMGLSTLFQSNSFKIIVGLVGGAFLIWMGLQMLRQLAQEDYQQEKMYAAGPIFTGFLLSVSNPYFLFWWATVGLGLTIQAKDFGWMAFLLFALIHWMCDLVWLTIISLTAFHGTNILGVKNQTSILRICGIALFFFAVKFIYEAIVLWAK